jgi:L-amino acid N-acyltransferase YncA
MTKRKYPLSIPAVGGDIEIRPLSPADEAAVLAFAGKQPQHDLLFLPRDISEPKVLAAWIKESERGEMVSLVAARGKTIIGCGALARDSQSWSPHVGELRVLVGGEARGHGVGRTLTQELFACALEMGLEKIVAHMTADQTYAIRVFEDLGFRSEALLRQQVKDRSGKTHDIVVLGQTVSEILSHLQAFGFAVR